MLSFAANLALVHAAASKLLLSCSCFFTFLPPSSSLLPLSYALSFLLHCLLAAVHFIICLQLLLPHVPAASSILFLLSSPSLSFSPFLCLSSTTRPLWHGHSLLFGVSLSPAAGPPAAPFCLKHLT